MTFIYDSPEEEKIAVDNFLKEVQEILDTDGAQGVVDEFAPIISDKAKEEILKGTSLNEGAFKWGSEIEGMGMQGPNGADKIFLASETPDDSDDSDEELVVDQGGELPLPFDPWQPPNANEGPEGGFFDDPPEDLEGNIVPRFTDQEIADATAFLNAELRIAGFDVASIQSMISRWIIPRLTGTYTDSEGITLLPPDSAEALLPELFEQEEFKTRFPGYHQRLDAGYNAIDIRDYLDYETRFNELMSNFGLDTYISQGSKAKQTYIGDLVAGNISIQQLDKRINQGVAAVLNAPDSVLQKYKDWYGPDGENALLATFLDPNADLMDLGKQAQSAIAGGYSSAILGSENTIGKQMAEEIADLDYSNQQLQQAYTALAQQTALFAEKAGEEDFTISREGVEYALNLDQDVTKRIERRRMERRGEFSGGGGASLTGGVTGFGSANA